MTVGKMNARYRKATPQNNTLRRHSANRDTGNEVGISPEKLPREMRERLICLRHFMHVFALFDCLTFVL